MTAKTILDEIGKIRWMLPGSIRRASRDNRLGEPVSYFRYYAYGPGTKKTDRRARTRTAYVLPADVPEMERLIAAGKRFDELVARYRELVFAQTRRERKLPSKPKRKRKIPKPPAPEEPITVSTRRIEPGAAGLSTTRPPGP